MSRSDEHWRWRFGLGPDEYPRRGVTVVAHGSPFFRGYQSAWIFQHEEAWVITVPSELLDQTRERVGQVPSRQLHSGGAVRHLFGDRITRMIGPAFQGFLEERADFCPFDQHQVRLYCPEDRAALGRLVAACDPQEVERSDVVIDDVLLYVCPLEDELVSVAKPSALGVDAVGIGVLTPPRFRGRGLGKAAVGALIEVVLAEGKVVVYQTPASNLPSVNLALGLGVRDYGRSLAIRLAY